MRYLSALVFFLSLSAYGAKSDSYVTEVQKLSPFDASEPELNIDEKQIGKSIKASEKKRSPAQNGSELESQISPEMKNFRARFLGAKTPDQLDAVVEDLEGIVLLGRSDRAEDVQKFRSTPDDVKFLATQIAPMRKLRGFVYRLAKVFELNSPAVHSRVLSIAKNSATNFRIYLPYEHMSTVYDYFTAPYFVGKRKVSQWKTAAEIQAFLSSELRSSLVASLIALYRLPLEKGYIVWDQQFVYGPSTFEDGLNRYRLVGEFEKTLTMGALAAAAANLDIARAYNVNGTIELSKDIGMLYGLDAPLRINGRGVGNVDGVTAEKITKVIQKESNSHVGQILPDGQQFMTRAYDFSRNSVKLLGAAWEASARERGSETVYAINTGYLRINRDELEQNISLLKRVVFSSGEEKLRSAVTGEVISVNYAAMFKPAPEHLQAFLPQTFEGDTEKKVTTRGPAGKNVEIKYRNYLEGSPKTWKVAEYKKYFPSVKNNEDVFRVLRVLSHAGGNWLVPLK